MILTIVVFFIVLGILVLAHETGHFFAARRGGVRVDEYGLGLPPRLIGFYKNEQGKWKKVGAKTKKTPSTIWSLNWIPLGGFVKIKGEEGEDAQDEDSFVNKSVGRRIWIVSAGVTMNVILAAVILTIGLVVGSPQIIEEGKLPPTAKVVDLEIRILEVLPNSPADKAEIEVGDTIISIDQNEFTGVLQVQEYLSNKGNTPVVLEIKRDNENIQTELTPIVLSETQKTGMGVALVETGMVSYPWYIAWIYGIRETFQMIWAVIYGFYFIIKNLIISHEMVGEVYGPIGIATLVGDAARMGFLYVMQITAALSVIIAVINFLPFPALDGGRVLFLLIEAIRKKPINQKFENAMHNIGFALLMILILIVTFKDIARISTGWWDKIAGLF